MHACDMTLTYLRGGLPTCSVVWGSVQYVFIRFTKSMMQLCKNLFQNLLKTTAHTFFFQEPFTLAQLFLGVLFCCSCL